MRPSGLSTTLKDTLAPTLIASFRETWAPMVTRAPVWTRIGNGSMVNWSRVNGSGLPPEKNDVDM